MTPIFDTRAYALPAMELVYERGTPQFRGQWPHLEELLAIAAPQSGIGDWDEPYLYLPDTGEPVSGAWPTTVIPPGVELPQSTNGSLEAGILHDNPEGRLRAMDAAGVDIQMIGPGPSIDACITLPSNLAAGVLGAYNRYVTTHCEANSERLKSIIQVHGGDPYWSAREIRDLADDPSVAAVAICLPVKLAPDEENFRPIWEAVSETGLPVVQRPGFAAVIWTPRRFLTYLNQTGVLAAFPRLRFIFSGFGTGWLDDTMSALGHDRVFVTVTGRESDAELKRVIGTLGEETLLWGSAFPYNDGKYRSADVLNDLTGEDRDLILETNATRCLMREGA